MFWYFATSARRKVVTPALREARMWKKRFDKQQNQEEPPVSLGRHMPQPASVDHEAFARRAGEIIGNSNTSLHYPKGRPAVINGRGAVDERRLSKRGRR